MEVTRVFDILERLKTFAPKKDILNGKVNKQWVHYSLQDFIDRVDDVGAALLHLGLESGNKVALMAGNMPQWNFVDYGSQQVDMPTVPIFPTISNEDLQFILNHCEARIIFISERGTYAKLVAMEKELPHLQYVFSFTPIEGVRDFSEFIELGRQYKAPGKIAAIKQNIRPENLLTILYTSGTTGQPKGVMLSHDNLLQNVFTCRNIAPFTTKWRALSFLPLNHVYERFLNTLYLYEGVSIYYAESFETIGENCREIHPELFVAVPRVLERVLERILSAGEKLSGFKRKLFDWSIRLAEKYELKGANGWWYELQRTIASGLVYKKWRDAVGGKIVVIVSGGAALNPRIERMFACAGLTLLQGYGLTETCVVVSVNRIDPDHRMFGTVGLPVANSEVVISPEDGEILMKGPSLMLGYYRNQEATDEAIDGEGWFHTGDIGTFVDNKFLKITDRKKELFKCSSGKYIAPALIENRLKESKFIEQCMVIGEGQKFASALIIPSVSNFKALFEAKKLAWPGNDQLREHEVVQGVIADHVKKVNTSLASYEQIKRYQLINAMWSVETGEITPKLSLRRKVIKEKNQSVINRIFGEGS